MHRVDGNQINCFKTSDEGIKIGVGALLVTALALGIIAVLAGMSVGALSGVSSHWWAFLTAGAVAVVIAGAITSVKNGFCKESVETKSQTGSVERTKKSVNVKETRGAALNQLEKSAENLKKSSANLAEKARELREREEKKAAEAGWKFWEW